MRAASHGLSLAGVAGALHVVMVGGTLQTPLYVLYQRRMGFSDVTLTLLYSTYMLGTLVALVFFGRVSDQIGRRRALLPALGLTAASMVVFLGGTLPLLFVGRAMLGFAVGIVTGTATAWIAELSPGRDKRRASGLASADMLLGLGVGPLLAGVLAQYAPSPLLLPYVVETALLVAGAAAIWKAKETVGARAGRVSLRPRVGVPRPLRPAFVAPAAAVFSVFSVSGLFAALAPTLLLRGLHETSHAIAGAVVLLMYGVGALAVALVHAADSRKVMIAGMVALLAALALVVLSLPERSLPIFLAGTVLSGLSLGLGFQGSLRVVNDIAPAERRAEMLSAYFVVAYLGVALPVIGVGALEDSIGQVTANVVFAAVIGAVGIAAMVFAARRASGGSEASGPSPTEHG